DCGFCTRSASSAATRSCSTPSQTSTITSPAGLTWWRMCSRLMPSRRIIWRWASARSPLAMLSIHARHSSGLATGKTVTAKVSMSAPPKYDPRRNLPTMALRKRHGSRFILGCQCAWLVCSGVDREGGGMVQDLDIARWRLRSQHLVWPHAVSAGEAIGSLLAVQAENSSQAAWAVASRTSNPDQADLAALLDHGTGLRTHVLRPTWHFVRAEDAGWLLDLTGPRIRRVTGQQLRNAHGLDGRSIDHAVTGVTEALASRGQLTRAQLADELRDRGIPGSG